MPRSHLDQRPASHRPVVARLVLLTMALSAIAIPAASHAAPAVRDIEAITNEFLPAVARAVSGDTLRWTVTEGSHDVATYGGTASFRSPLMSRTSVPYEQPYSGGDILYRCNPHSSISAGGTCIGMCGAITDRTLAPGDPSITQPAQGAVVSSATVSFAGTGEAWTTVRLTRNGTLLAEALVKADGRWLVGVRLSSGSHTVTAQARDVEGTLSASSASVTFRISSSAPDTVPPTVRITTESVGAFVGTARIDGIASDDSAVAAIWIDVYDLSGQPTGRIQATCAACPAPNVSWTAQVPTGPGLHVVRAIAEDTASPANRSAPSEPVYALVVALP